MEPMTKMWIEIESSTPLAIRNLSLDNPNRL